MIPTSPTLPVRMLNAVRTKLGTTHVSLVCWIENRDGSHTPVFSVPSTHAELARGLGLTIKSCE
jgi:hypothetical protein